MLKRWVLGLMMALLCTPGFEAMADAAPAHAKVQGRAKHHRKRHHKRRHHAKRKRHHHAKASRRRHRSAEL